MGEGRWSRKGGGLRVYNIIYRVFTKSFLLSLRQIVGQAQAQAPLNKRPHLPCVNPSSCALLSTAHAMAVLMARMSWRRGYTHPSRKSCKEHRRNRLERQHSTYSTHMHSASPAKGRGRKAWSVNIQHSTHTHGASPAESRGRKAWSVNIQHSTHTHRASPAKSTGGIAWSVNIQHGTHIHSASPAKGRGKKAWSVNIQHSTQTHSASPAKGRGRKAWSVNIQHCTHTHGASPAESREGIAWSVNILLSLSSM